MTFTVKPANLQTLPVADCNVIGQMRAEAEAERGAIASASESVIDAHYRRITGALDAQASERQATLDAVRAAQAASGGQVFALARTAVKSSADLFVTIAIQTRNPQLIGAAVGIDLVIDTADFVHQVVRAENVIQTQEAVNMLLKDRTVMVQSLVSGPGRAFSQKQFATAKAITEVMKEIAETAASEARLKARLADAEQALEEIETQVANLPVNNAAMRQYMIDTLNADIFVLDILQTEFSSSGCRIDDMPLPGPVA